MNLCVFLSIGESIKDFQNKGQDSLFINNNLKNYSENFEKVYVFSYENESYRLFGNVFVLPNNHQFSRFAYALISPVIHRNLIRECSIVRGYQLTGGIPAVVCKLLFKKKIVINYGYPYSDVAKVEKKPVRAFLFELLNRLILPLCNRIIVTANIMRPFVNKYNRKISLIPNGVNIGIFQPAKIAKKTYTCVFVGRLEPQKNLLVLIHALSLLPMQHRSLLLIGDGSQKKELMSLSARSKVKIKIIKKITNSKLPSYYNSAKIFVLPSLVEGHPKALLEAMACGIPAVANNVTGINTVIKHEKNGLLFAHTQASLKKQLQRLLTNRTLYTKLSRSGREYVKNYYDFNELKKKEINLLKSI